MPNKQTNWVLVADGGQARLFKYTDQYDQLQQILHLVHPHPLNHEQGADKPGRTFGSATILKHAYEPKTDWHEHQKKDFFKKLAHFLIKSYEDKEFKRITLVCPAHLVGSLRDTIHTHLSKIQPPLNVEDIKVIAKDYTHLNKDEIQRKLQAI
ncbi:host attachment protein [Candidatus Finniella inopinata]|uniref:Host attachment protein n=1 Tax=Candidatus Finniella inopinata TaxID=1696036 RepID=A0A4Q7DLK2_9PROT|nr:host attachment protein [Candidatus Finniella inopinata]RZI45606.1 host attachment protein [Candidatus Finniella inopinata]